jgi:hypothetical protein
MRWKAAAAAVGMATVLGGCFGGPIGGTGGPTVLVVGDSLSYQIAAGLERVQGSQITTVNEGIGGCGVGPGEIEAFGDGSWTPSACPNWQSDWQALVDSVNPTLVVLHTGWWESFDRRVNGQVLPFGSAQNDAQLLAAYEQVVQVLSSRGAQIAWVNTPCFEPATWEGRTFEYADWKIDHLNDLYESFTASHPQTTLIDYRSAVCPGDQYSQVVNGVVIRPADGIHYTVQGETVVASWLLPHLVALSS